MTQTHTAQHTLWERLRLALPEGRALPDGLWLARHRIVVGFVLAHSVGLAIFGLVRGWSPAFAIGEGALIAMLGGIAAIPRLSRAFRSSTAALGAVTSSAVFTQFMGGYIEGHFHYFVVVALIALYQDWVPFLLAIAFVALDHGIIGTLAPQWVYNHPAAIASPWTWGVIHATLVLAECTILIALWKSSEDATARTDLVLDAAGEGIVGLDRAGNVTFANPAAGRMLGQKVEHLLGHPFEWALMKASDGKPDLGVAALRSAETEGTLAGRGTAWFMHDGVRKPVDWTMNPILDHGTPVGNVLTISDATERLRAEDEHTRRIRQFSEIERLKELDRFKSLFINTAAHELHTPLTPLRLNVYALKEGHRGALTDAQRDTIEVLDRNVERLSHLVDDVLNVARLQANTMTIQKEQTPLHDIVAQAVESFAEPARAAGIDLRTRLETDLIASADARRLSQVLYNLLDNAIKFTPAGGTIHIEAVREAGAALIRVRDTGTGIDPAEIGNLFRPFSQAHSHMERTRAGSGLGLYICKGIVDLHGGRIECKSDGIGKGTELLVRVPLVERTDGKDTIMPVH